MSRTCVKCGYVRQPSDTAPDYECPKCGVIYAKAEAALAVRVKAASPRHEEHVPGNDHLEPKKFGVYVLIAVACTAFLIGSGGTYLLSRRHSSPINTLQEASAPPLNTIKAIKRDPVAAKAIETAQQLSFRTESGISYREYAAAVSDLAVAIKTYLASEEARQNIELSHALEQVLNARIKAREVWYYAISNDMSAYIGEYQIDRFLGTFPELRAYYNSEVSSRSSSLSTSGVLNFIWRQADVALNDAKRLNGETKQYQGRPSTK